MFDRNQTVKEKNGHQTYPPATLACAMAIKEEVVAADSSSFFWASQTSDVSIFTIWSAAAAIFHPWFLSCAFFMFPALCLLFVLAFWMHHCVIISRMIWTAPASFVKPETGVPEEVSLKSCLIDGRNEQKSLLNCIKTRFIL